MLVPFITPAAPHAAPNMNTVALRQLTPEESRDERIIQDMASGHEITTVALVHGVTIDHIQDLFQPPRFMGNRNIIKAVEMARLDVAIRALMPRVERGELDAIDRLVKVQNRRSRYLGLDAPAQVESRADINVTISWATADRLSYAKGSAEVVDIAPAAVPAPVLEHGPWKPAEPSKDPEVKFSDAMEALGSKQGPAVGTES